MISTLRFIFCSALIVAASFAHAEEGRPEPLTIDNYKPMDLLIGNPYTKIDVSFKSRILQDHNLYFGYEQKMFWEVLQSNKYFEDINYSPEIFYRFYIDGAKRWLDFSPLQHESNGVGYQNERSWNRSYVRYHSANLLGGETTAYWSVTGWIPYDDERNTDIYKYRGFYELNATISNWMGDAFAIGDVTFRIYPGGPTGLDPLRGGQEISFRFKPKAWGFTPPIELQIFHGYGENLLDYKINHFEFRAGISL